MNTVTIPSENTALHSEAIRELERLQDLRENDPLALAHVADAIKSASPGAITRERQCQTLERICHAWNERKELDQQVGALLDKLGHPGLREIVQMDWREALQHGQSEVLWLVEKLTRTTDEHEVEAVLVDFHTPGVNEEDTWILDERE